MIPPRVTAVTPTKFEPVNTTDEPTTPSEVDSALMLGTGGGGGRSVVKIWSSKASPYADCTRQRACRKPVFGSVTVIWVAESTWNTGALTPPSVTAVASLKPVPVSRTC